MKFNKSLVAGAAVLLSSASMAEVNVNGVVWNELYDDGFGSVDFFANSTFKQWYTTNDNSGTKMVTQSDIDGAVAVASQDSWLTGVGKITNINDSGSFCDVAGCELTYAFGGISFDFATETFSTAGTGWFAIYSDSNASTEFGGSIGDFVDAQNGQDFLYGTIDTFGLGSGLTLLSGSSEGLLSATGGDAFWHFDTNTQPIFNPFADLKFSGSANFDGTNAVYSRTGSIEFIGDSIPVPAPLALLGLGLVALGLRARKS